jgi:large subunit ribosomal protein L37e
MGKGTPAFGLNNKGATHKMCRRCGSRSYHRTKRECSACGYGASPKLRKYKWQNRTKKANGFAAHNIRSIRLKRRGQLHYNLE